MLMALPIFLEGKEYISASRVAKKIGYASDYIGQLCRAKKFLENSTDIDLMISKHTLSLLPPLKMEVWLMAYNVTRGF